MSGVLVFNGYTHDTDSVGIKIDVDISMSKYKMPLLRTERWTIVGAILSNGASASLQTKMNEIEAAYKAGGENYGTATYTANGNVHTLTDSASLSGIRCVKFGYMTGPWKMQTELSNRRSYYAVLEADYLSGSAGDVVGYKEEVIQIGLFGNKFRYMPSLAGVPEYQTLQVNTPATIIQRGMLVQLGSDPTANASIFSSTFMHNERCRVGRIAPEILMKNGTSQTNLMRGIEWYYEAEYASAPSLTYFDVPIL